MKELSASALQILEKKARKEKMLKLAIGITINQIIEFLEVHGEITDKAILSLVQKNGISRSAFINEYLANESEGVSVRFETAKGYYKEERDRLKPSFIEFHKKGERKPYFYVAENLVRQAITKARELKKART